MADKKISALTGASTPLAGTEVLPIVQSGSTVKVAVSDLTAGRSVSGTSFVATGSTIPANGLYLPAANSVGLATNTTNAIYINSSQNVGIGTSSPSVKLTVGDASSGTQIQVNSSAWADIILKGPNTNGGSILWNNGTTDKGEIFYYHVADYMAFKTNATERMRIDSAGIVTMSAYGAGAATFSAAGVISSVSDETWKIKDGVPVDTDSMLKKLEPGYWYYNDEKKEIFGVDRQLGFYAQNVNAAIGPEAAPHPEEGKPWGYYDRSVLAVTVMSLQKALATIESLTARIVALEAKITA